MNTTKLKQLNIAKIINFVTEEPNCTVAQVARGTALSIATCGNIMNELLKSEELLETGLDRYSGGRPAKRYSINPDFFHVLCIQLYVTGDKDYIQYLIANRIGQIIEFSQPLQVTVDINRLSRVIENALGKDHLIRAVGIGVPGMVYEGKVDGNCDNRKLRDIDLLAELTDRFDLQFIAENNMNLIALGYFRIEECTVEESITIVNFPPNDCIGAGTVIGGKLLNGKSSFSGELSYLPFSEFDEQRHIVSFSEEEYTLFVARIIQVVIPLLNPNSLILTGAMMNETIFKKSIELCSTKIPAAHMPNMLMEVDTLEAYKVGLLYTTILSLERVI